MDRSAPALLLLPLCLASCVRLGFAPAPPAGDGATRDQPQHVDLVTNDGTDSRADAPPVMADAADAASSDSNDGAAGVGTWQAITAAGSPAPRRMHTYVWTGNTGNSQSANRLIVWGGQDASGPLSSGGIFDPGAGTWAPMAASGAPQPRWWSLHAPIWTGNTGTGSATSCLIVWGGVGLAGNLNDGGIYRPATDTWKAMSTTNAPSARSNHVAVWTGSTGNPSTAERLIVWGGGTAGSTNTGGIYDPATDAWTAMTTVGAPQHRAYHSGVWTGPGGATPNRLIVWGGLTGALGQYNYTNTGGIYDPATDTWTPTSVAGAPQARRWHTAVWTGSANPGGGRLMIVWGGEAQQAGTNTGGIYDPSTDTWKPTTTVGAPSARWDHRAVWTGTRMLVWKGVPASGMPGALYDPAADSWTSVSGAGVSTIRRYHGLVWTGSSAIEWGGETTAASYSGEGGVLSGL